MLAKDSQSRCCAEHYRVRRRDDRPDDEETPWHPLGTCPFLSFDNFPHGLSPLIVLMACLARSCVRHLQTQTGARVRHI